MIFDDKISDQEFAEIIAPLQRLLTEHHAKAEDRKAAWDAMLYTPEVKS